MSSIPGLVNNRRGSSLTATLVALGISGIIISTILTTVTMGWGQLAQQEGRANRALLNEDIRAELSDAKRCQQALAAHSSFSAGASGIPLKIKFANGLDVAAGASLKEYGQRVKSFKFISRMQNPVSATETSHYGDVVLHTEMLNGKTIEFSEKSIGKLSMLVTNTNVIKECNMAGLNSIDEICQTLGGSWDGKSCKLPPKLLAVNDLCKEMGGTWKSNACQWTVASAPTPSSTPPPPAPNPTPTPSTPSCMERNENVTWCVKVCAQTPAATATSNPREKWTLINQVSSEKVKAPNCPNTGYRSTCRYRVTCR